MTRASCLPLKKGAFSFSTNRVFTLLENDGSDSSVTLQHLGESFSEPSLTKARSSVKKARGSMSSSSEISFPPYEVVPATRPIIVIGPSLRGYEVTDLMHRALYNFLKKRFSGKISVYRTHADIGLSKRSKNNPSEKERFNITKTGGPRMTAEVQKEVERIYELTKGLNMVVIDCDAINHPSQLLDCSLAPIAVYIKMEPQILEKLVKLRGSKRKNLGAQVVAAQKLAQCNEEMFDLVLDEAIFEDACEHLGEFLDQYWRDLHPNDCEDGAASLSEKMPLLQGPSRVPALKGAQGLAKSQQGQSPLQSVAGGKQGSPLKGAQQQGGQRERQGTSGSQTNQRKIAVSGNAPDFGKKLHEAFQSSQSHKTSEPEYQSSYGQEPPYDQHQQLQQQYYGQGEHYEQEQHYGSEMYGHQQGYTTEPYHQGYQQQYSHDGHYGYEQYGQDPNQGYSHGYENQYPDSYYNRDVSMGYQQQYRHEMDSPYQQQQQQQQQEWYGDSSNYYGGDGYYQ
ncbi:voltage-dependent L-type calcium channel subunit beta-2-like isoform X1 [Pocillopora damicornis]|uniref:voltage-dependent L-type calcium channel subunit beta-2-like isoform X1 n=2 Tax=Pocillopora damicornis TaxID=46731 RepID=UPI000F5577BC|nr:voltage-dependent L-type calcium channel subunit beta-2-like isoform X1 [Pocillopora damicornis]